MNFKALIYSIVALAALASCSKSTTQLPYFQDLTAKQGELPLNNYLQPIKPDDELYISVTSTSPEATAMYNVPTSNPAVKSTLPNVMTPTVQTYIVNSEGNILFPELGTIHVEGMTTEGLQKYLTEMISKDVDNPMVKVELINFQVNVGGEVQNPKTIPVTRSRFSILDALSAAGDLTPYGERSNVLIIRENGGKREFARLDLNSSDLLTSPYYYLQQNDYIYVEPNSIRQANSKYNQDNAFKLSVISTIVSASSVIASLVIALTVK